MKINKIILRLKKSMLDKDLNNTEVSKLTGISPPTMGRYLSNKTDMTVRNLIKLDKALNTKIFNE